MGWLCRGCLHNGRSAKSGAIELCRLHLRHCSQAIYADCHHRHVLHSKVLRYPIQASFPSSRAGMCVCLSLSSPLFAFWILKIHYHARPPEFAVFVYRSSFVLDVVATCRRAMLMLLVMPVYFNGNSTMWWSFHQLKERLLFHHESRVCLSNRKLADSNMKLSISWLNPRNEEFGARVC
jgi:hypothetical protein